MGASSSRKKKQSSSAPKDDQRHLKDLPCRQFNELYLSNDEMEQHDPEAVLLRCGRSLNKLVIADCYNSDIIPIIKRYCLQLKLLEL